VTSLVEVGAMEERSHVKKKVVAEKVDAKEWFAEK
jgi:hypothetical protein